VRFVVSDDIVTDFWQEDKFSLHWFTARSSKGYQSSAICGSFALRAE
jgi:hypothetical protein